MDTLFKLISDPFIAKLLAIPLGLFLLIFLFGLLIGSRFGPWIIAALIVFFVYLITR